MVGNGVFLSVNYTGHSIFPFSNHSLKLNNVLVSNKIVKNIIMLVTLLLQLHFC